MSELTEKYIIYGEDDLVDQELLTIAFQQLNPEIELICVNDGLNVIEFLDAIKPGNNFPCLIVLDINMPILNGIQTLKILKEERYYQNIPVVIFSTADQRKDRNAALDLGAADYFRKPVKLEEIEEVTKEFLKYCEIVTVKHK